MREEHISALSLHVPINSWGKWSYLLQSLQRVQSQCVCLTEQVSVYVFEL